MRGEAQEPSAWGPQDVRSDCRCPRCQPVHPSAPPGGAADGRSDSLRSGHGWISCNAAANCQPDAERAQPDTHAHSHPRHLTAVDAESMTPVFVEPDPAVSKRSPGGCHVRRSQRESWRILQRARSRASRALPAARRDEQARSASLRSARGRSSVALRAWRRRRGRHSRAALAHSRWTAVLGDRARRAGLRRRPRLHPRRRHGVLRTPVRRHRRRRSGARCPKSAGLASAATEARASRSKLPAEQGEDQP